MCVCVCVCVCVCLCVCVCVCITYIPRVYTITPQVSKSNALIIF